MRIVLDTNVLVSGIFFNGPPFEVLKLWRNGLIQLVVTNDILSEYSNTTNRISKKYQNVNINSILELLTIKSEIISETIVKPKVSRHSADDKFLHCAISGKVSIIVSGDKHLLELVKFNNIEILPPSEFIKRFTKKQKSTNP